METRSDLKRVKGKGLKNSWKHRARAGRDTDRSKRGDRACRRRVASNERFLVLAEVASAHVVARVRRLQQPRRWSGS
eukprot:6178644-Pleurochrysis_carterae.AAC.4